MRLGAFRTSAPGLEEGQVSGGHLAAPPGSVCWWDRLPTQQESSSLPPAGVQMAVVSGSPYPRVLTLQRCCWLRWHQEDQRWTRVGESTPSPRPLQSRRAYRLVHPRFTAEMNQQPRSSEGEWPHRRPTPSPYSVTPYKAKGAKHQGQVYAQHPDPCGSSLLGSSGTRQGLGED